MILLSGCKKDDNNPVGPVATQDPSITTISGKINNWTLGKGYKLELGWRPNVYATTSIDSLGNFSFAPLGIVPSSGLDATFLQGVSRSDPSSITSGYYFLLVYAPNSQSYDYAVGQIQFENTQFEEAYLYANKPTTFNGKYSEEGGIVVNCSFSIKTGWNRITITNTSNSSYSITNSAITGGVWKYSQQ